MWSVERGVLSVDCVDVVVFDFLSDYFVFQDKVATLNVVHALATALLREDDESLDELTPASIARPDLRRQILRARARAVLATARVKIEPKSEPRSPRVPQFQVKQEPADHLEECETAATVSRAVPTIREIKTEPGLDVSGVTSPDLDLSLPPLGEPDWTGLHRLLSRHQANSTMSSLTSENTGTVVSDEVSDTNMAGDTVLDMAEIIHNRVCMSLFYLFFSELLSLTNLPLH